MFSLLWTQSELNLFIYLLHKCLLVTVLVPDTVQIIGEPEMSKMKPDLVKTE